jgi:hypothetical protein
MLATLAGAFAALALAGTAAADIVVGVADDRGKYADDGGAWFFNTLRGAGMTENRVMVQWDPGRPSLIIEKPFFDRAMPQAAARGVRVVFAVYAANTALSAPSAPESFAAYLAQLARTYPQVKHFVVGNEPNLTRFWHPQFNPDGSNASAPAYQAVLARAYDALKGVDPSIRVIGAGLSERGNDNPTAASNVSTSPVRFVKELGAAYRASGRKAPIMDEFDIHPYPESAGHDLLKSYSWPNIGYGNLDRLKQALWDAFHGTAQPTVEEGLKLRIGEIGWQVGVAPGTGYIGNENVAVTDEARQAQIYAELLRHAACDPSISSLNIFGLADEVLLAGWQAGLLRHDGTARASYDAIRTVLAETGGRCAGSPRSWRHTEQVVGAGVDFGDLSRPRWHKQRSWRFAVTADEDATYKAGVFRLPEQPSQRAAAVRRLTRSLAVSAPRDLVFSASGAVSAHWNPQVRFPSRQLKPGLYAYAVSLAAAMNPDRTSAFVSKPFRVEGPAAKK